MAPKTLFTVRIAATLAFVRVTRRAFTITRVLSLSDGANWSAVPWITQLPTFDRVPPPDKS